MTRSGDHSRAAPPDARARPARHPRFPLAGTALLWLGALALFAFVGGLKGAASNQTQTASQAARLLIEGTGAVRQAYWVRSRVALGGREAALNASGRRGLDCLRQLADLQRSERTLRMLALARYALGEPNWRRPLLLLATTTPRRTRAEVDRELAFWRTTLDPTGSDPGQVHAALAFVRSLRLGWYEHIALAALYDRHGLGGRASQHRAAALRSTDLLTAMVAAAALLGLGGSVLWLVAVVLWFVTRKAMREFASLRLRALPGGSSRVLCLVGAAYFAGLVALRLASPLVGRLLSQLGGGDGAPAARAVASALFALLALVPPAAVLLVHGRPLGLRLGDLGVTKFRPLRDLPAGLVGYAAVVPFLAVSLAASAALFEPSSSRINPAVLEFAMSKGLVHRLTLFALGAVIAPLVEEFMFRGVLLRALQPALGFVGSVVLTSAVFAMLHPQLPMGFLSIFVLGVGFSILYGLTGSLWPSVLAHAINNGLVLGYLALYLGG